MRMRSVSARLREARPSRTMAKASSSTSAFMLLYSSAALHDTEPGLFDELEHAGSRGGAGLRVELEIALAGGGLDQEIEIGTGLACRLPDGTRGKVLARHVDGADQSGLQRYSWRIVRHTRPNMPNPGLTLTRPALPRRTAPRRLRLAG